MSAETRVRVIGCGNDDAADDAAGLLALREVVPTLAGFAGVEVVEAGPALRLLDLVAGAEAVIVVDAVRSASGARRPGELVRAEASTGGFADVRSALSSHGVDVASVLALAETLGRTRRVVFLGVEIEDVTAGGSLTPAVSDAVPRLAELILAEVEYLRKGEPVPGGKRR